MSLPQLSAGSYLDESASLEESCEQILCYYDAEKFVGSSGNGTETTQDSIMFRYRTQEAAQFVALCSALYSLPASIDSKEEEASDATEFVYLEKSLLVFVKLESSPLVLAVAQVSRSQVTDSNGDCVGSGGSPLAIKSLILQSYYLFKLIRGGGIHYRLTQVAISDGILRPCDDNTPDDEFPYPGMRQLYELRKRLRKARDKITIHDTETRVSESETMQQLELEIQQLELELPIHALRADLSVHFNDLMEELTAVGAYSVKCVNRCLVESLPKAIAPATGCHKFSSTPRLLNLGTLDQVNHCVQQVIDAENQDWDTGEPFLLGVTTVSSGQLISSSYCKSDEAHLKFELSLQTAYAIMGYIDSFRNKIAIHHNGNPTTPGSPSSRFQPLIPFESTDGPSGDDHDSVARSEGTLKRHGQFLCPPPLSMLSATDQVHDLPGPDGERIWAPRLYLPNPGNDANGWNTIVDVHMLIFEVKELCFLLFFTPDPIFSASSNDFTSFESESFPTISQAQDKFSGKLVSISSQLTECVEQLFLDRKPGPSDTLSPDNLQQSALPPSNLEWKEPGQDVIFVDRSSNQFMLFSDRLTEAFCTDKKKVQRSPARSPSRSFLSRLKGKKPQRGTAQESWLTAATNGSTIGLDCRHFLASLLPIASLLALDDIMNDIQLRREQDCTGNSGDDRGLWEASTFTANGWIYACSQGQKELYIFLDSSVYATVADVQNAAARVRKELLNNAL